jgi:cell division protease FtsH
MDEEVRRIVEEAHEQVVVLLRENRDKLDSLAQALLERETLDEAEAYAAAAVTRAATDPAREEAMAAQRMPNASAEASEPSVG